MKRSYWRLQRWRDRLGKGFGVCFIAAALSVTGCATAVKTWDRALIWTTETLRPEWTETETKGAE